MSILGFLSGKHIEMTPEQKITQAQIDQLRRLERGRKTEKLRGQLGWVFKGVIPKGIRNPDSLIVNKHLYIGGSGKTRLK